jgi:hypothetical protein
MYEENAKEKEAVKTTDVATELRAADEATARLASLLERLESRLGPVLQTPTKETGSGATPQESRVPLADAIRSQRYSVERSANAVESVLSRLQL